MLLGYHEVQNYRYQNSPVTLAGALELGNTPEELGINEEIVKKIQDLKLKLKYTNPEELSKDQITELASEVEGLEFDVLKSKISEKLDLKQEDITLHPSDPKNDISAFVFDEKNQKMYSEPELFNKGGISENIGDLINELGSVQYLASGYSKGSNKDILNDLTGAVNNIDKFAGAEVSLNNDGKVVVKYTKIKEVGGINKGKEIGE